MTANNPFLDEVEAFLSAHEMPATTFGVMALKDGKFVFTLREGRDTRRSTESKVRDFMASYKPSGKGAAA